MPSIHARCLTAFLRATDFKKARASPEELRRAAVQTEPSNADVAAIRSLVSVEGDVTQQGQVVTLTPRRSTNTVILYLHGGGWVFPAGRLHWRFIAGLANETGAAVRAALYPLAPANSFRDVIDFLLPVYRGLINFPGKRVVVVGDSAGGTVALSLLLAVRDEGLPMPARLVLIAPPVDLTFSNPAMSRIESRDPIVALTHARTCATWYVGDLPPGDARVSPLRGSLKHLPQTQLFIGTNDLLLPDNRLFRDRARSEGVSIDYHEGAEMIHCWPLIPFLPEASMAMRQMAEFVMHGIRLRNGNDELSAYETHGSPRLRRWPIYQS